MRLAILRTPAGQAVARVNVADDKCAYECAVAHGGEIYWYAGTDHGEPVFVSGSEFAPRGDS